MTTAFALNLGFADVLRAAGLELSVPRGYGPAGLAVDIVSAGRRGTIIVTQAPWLGPGAKADPWKGLEFLHASISFTDQMPRYEDLALLHRAVFGRRRWAYQVFAPEASHINGKDTGMFGHEFALHLWGRADGAPMMPDQGSVFGTV